MRSAIFVSAAMHMSLIGLGFSSDAGPIRRTVEQMTPMTVDYFVLADMDKSVAPKSQAEIRVVEAPKGGRHSIDMKLARQTEPAVDTMRRKPIIKEDLSRQTAVKEPLKKRAEIKSTKEYAAYFDVIREKIRERLESNYKYNSDEGEVQIVFVLRMDGSLVTVLGVRPSATNAVLMDIAVSSVREASPFSRFPSALSMPQMSFNLTVSFKEE